MKIINRETNRSSGQQAIVQSGGKYLLVTSVSNVVVDKTYIVECDKNGRTNNWNELYTKVPADHETVLKQLENGMLTTKEFNFMD